MRPLQLSFSGIRSYPGAVGPLDFTGKTLIAILGDTGAGKSTILEVITLGLYGNCTWTDGAQGADGRRRHPDEPLTSPSPTTGSAGGSAGSSMPTRTPSTHLLQNLDTGEQIDNKEPSTAGS